MSYRKAIHERRKLRFELNLYVMVASLFLTRFARRSPLAAVFQLTVMFSSFVIGGYTDRKRNYFTVTISLLISGALILAVCAHALDENR